MSQKTRLTHVDDIDVTACCPGILMAASLARVIVILSLSAVRQGTVVMVATRERRQAKSFITQPVTMVRNSLELMSDVTNYFIQVIWLGIDHYSRLQKADTNALVPLNEIGVQRKSISA